MARSTIKKMADMIRQSPYIIPIFMVVVAGLLVSLVLSANDYWTSYVGVNGLPIREVMPGSFDAFLRWASNVSMAALPQIVNILTVYVYIALDTKLEAERWLVRTAIVIGIVSYIVDVDTGFIYYFPFESSWAAILAYPTSAFWAFVRSAVVDTVGSEMLFVLCVGLYIQLRPDFKREVKAFRNQSVTKKRPASKPKGKGTQAKRSSAGGDTRRGGGQQQPSQQRPVFNHVEERIMNGDSRQPQKRRERVPTPSNNGHWPDGARRAER